MKRLLSIAVGIAVLAIVVGWVLVSERTSEGEASEPSRSTANARFSKEVPASSATGSRPVGRVEGAPFPSEPVAPETFGLKLLVVGPDGATPVSSAEIFWAARESIDPMALAEAKGSPERLSRTIAKVGTRTQSDERGELRLEGVRISVGVFARSGTLWNADWFEAVAGETAKLVLQPDGRLRIRVLDARGTPVVGAPVAIHSAKAVERRFWAGVTEDGGIAIARDLRRGARLEDSRLVAVPAFPLGADVGVPFDANNIRAEPIDIHLPPTGRLVVELRSGESGFLTSEPNRVTVSALSTAGRLSGSYDAVVVTQNGRAEFPLIGTGLDLSILARTFGGRDSGNAISARGPEHEGEEVVIALPVSTVSRVDGRVLHPDDSPVAEELVDITIVQHGVREGSVEDQAVATDATGRFKLWFGGSHQLLPGVRRSLEVRLRKKRDSGAGPPPSASVELPQPSPSGVIELGDIQVEKPAPLVRGRVVDSLGDPVPNATVFVECEPEPGGARTKSWTPVPSHEETTGPDGQFTIWYRAPPVALRLGASAQGFIDESRTPFVRGAENVVITLNAAGALEGAVLLDPSISPTLFEIWVTTQVADPAAGTPSRRRVPLDATGMFRARVLRPGITTVDLRLSSVGHVVLSIGGVLVEPGTTTRDPRLQAIDLRGKLRMIGVGVTDRTGRVIESAQVSYVEADGSLRLLLPGEAITTISPAVDVLVSAPGFRSSMTAGVMRDVAIVLERAVIPVRVVLADGVTIPAPPFGLRVQLSYASKSSEERFLEEVTEAVRFTNREARLSVARPGKHLIHIDGVRTEGVIDLHLGLVGVTPKAVEIPAGGLDAIVVTPAKDDIERVLK